MWPHFEVQRLMTFTHIGASGAYMSDCQLIEPTDNAKDEVIAEKLWKLSEELVGEKFEIGK